MATNTRAMAAQLTDLRRYLFDAMRQAKLQAAAETPDKREFHRGQGRAYEDAVDQLDNILLDEVVVTLVPAEDGPQ